MSVPQNLRNAFDTISQANLVIRQQRDIAEACIPAINDQIAQIAKTGLTADDVLWGDVVFEQPCTSPPGTDASHLLKVVLLIPDGLGIVRWDREEYLGALHESTMDLKSARQRFVRFDELEPALKALLLPQADPLFNRLAQIIQPPAAVSPTPSGWTR